MSEREHDPVRLDVEAFAKSQAKLAGRWPLQGLVRLAESSCLGSGSGPGSDVEWRLRGETRSQRGDEAQIWLHLSASARVPLECQRCLRPVDVSLEVDRHFRFVRDEAVAAQLDAESEDDVLALPRWLDVRELVEDELLLALPLVPRHDRCPTPLPVPVDATAIDEKPNPFAVLRALKHGRPS